MKDAMLDTMMDDMSRVAREPLRTAPATPAFRTWWEDSILPLLRDHALSEIRRTDQVEPALVLFRHDGEVTRLRLERLVGPWGTGESKEKGAFLHSLLPRIPGIVGCVLLTETWMLEQKKSDLTAEARAEFEKHWRGRSIADHPDRQEGVMFNVLGADGTGALMQLVSFYETIKVLAKHRPPRLWKETTFGKVSTTDPLARLPDGLPAFRGRFVPGDPGP